MAERAALRLVLEHGHRHEMIMPQSGRHSQLEEKIESSLWSVAIGEQPRMAEDGDDVAGGRGRMAP
jgi:hypothetical protein